jgi:hypothetical protein
MQWFAEKIGDHGNDCSWGADVAAFANTRLVDNEAHSLIQWWRGMGLPASFSGMFW